MKPNPFKPSALISLSLWVTALATLFDSTQAAPLGTAFTYQGRLVDNGSPANGTYDLRFTLYDALSAGGTVGVPITNAPTVVSNGLFTVTLDFGGGIFLGNARWLELGVRTNGSALAYSPLTPFQELTSSPNALYAPNAGTATTANSAAPGSINNTALAAGAVNSSSIADGSIAPNDLSPALLSNTFWRLTGNAATTPGVSFLGTPDNNALDFRVNNVRGLRIEPDLTFGSPNVIGGSAANFVAPGSVGNFIGAGGQPGGIDGTNSILNGNMNVIAGGYNNTISNAYEGTIAGGYYNSVGNHHGTVGGGEYNFASGVASTVPGGGNNTAAGEYSFAAGQHAKANHQGSFVWADNSTTADFASAANNQFLIRANFTGINRTTSISPGLEFFGVRAPVTNIYGGMYIETAGPGLPFYGYAQAGAINSWTYVDGTDGNKWKLNMGLATRLTVTTNGNVGFGTTTPASPVDILGGLWDLSNSEGDFRIGNPAYRLKIGVATGGGGSGDTRIRAQGGTSRMMLGSDTNDVLTVVGTNVGIGTVTPSSSLHVVGDTRSEGVTRVGSETGTAQAPDKGIITRRVRSTIPTAGGVVARTDKLTLERDGFDGGWRIVNVAAPGPTTIAFTGLTSAGATVNFVTSFFNPAAPGTTTVFTEAQNVVSLRGSFGDSYGVNHMTEVSLTRYSGDSYWTGTLTSTFNQ